MTSVCCKLVKAGTILARLPQISNAVALTAMVNPMVMMISVTMCAPRARAGEMAALSNTTPTRVTMITVRMIATTSFKTGGKGTSSA